MHAEDARKGGETEQRIYALSAWKESPLFSDRERAALALTDEVTRITDQGVSRETYNEALRQFGEKELAQAIMQIIAINAWNRIAVSTRMKRDWHSCPPGCRDGLGGSSADPGMVMAGEGGALPANFQKVLLFFGVLLGRGDVGTGMKLYVSILMQIWYMKKMPRQARIDTPGALQHIIRRGIEHGNPKVDDFYFKKGWLMPFWTISLGKISGI